MAAASDCSGAWGDFGIGLRGYATTQDFSSRKKVEERRADSHMDTIIAPLIARRRAKKISLLQLSHEIGVSYETLRRWELYHKYGKNIPNIYNYLAWREALGFDNPFKDPPSIAAE